jgi:hypothetical protein
MLAVRVECLDSAQQPVPYAVATGFLRADESGQLSLYTCWHVVTGLDPHALSLGFELPKRRFTRLLLQGVDKSRPGIEAIGASQSLVVPLYEDTSATTGPLLQLWEQPDWHVPNEYLNHIGLYLPTWNDVVRLALPAGLALSELQLTNQFSVLPGNVDSPAVGDKCLIVGYPYGFSAAGLNQPTPVAFTRFIASAHIAGPRKFEFFLDGYGAPGMSGGPVFIERAQSLYLLGIYTGDIFPDHTLHTREKVTAMGTVADLRLTLWGHLSECRTRHSNAMHEG